MELYEAIPMPDGDPIEHLKITVILIAIWYLVTLVNDKITR
jgi:hypothetical protein